MKKALTFIAIFSLSACTTIHFDKVPVTTEATVHKEQWHHNFILSLYEGSSPVDLNKVCQKQEWVTVKTETSFINGLAGAAASTIIGPMWTPKTVEISCK
ncbi:Bor/Iss family lipoprotein [Thalassotalea mangrovi]|uniref:Lipoprotein bor n=1 Tax=Thalassotalea mangrovi TaxID=2572245 RepID=A0A4U1B4F9_9GAMM|nr:hypothetical protein [Thalassotalea mangrovi]TKB44634.1 hypothetical protein E8M12_10845 [Thalassotalea mangrovi]